MPNVMITPEAFRQISAPHVDLLEAAGMTVIYPERKELARGALSIDEMANELQEADAVIASSEPYSAELINRLPRLQVLARCGVGFDAVDVAAVTAQKIPLTITPTANREAVAELMLTLLFAAAKGVLISDQAVRNGEWPRKLPLPIRGATVGLVGLGRIGQATAVRCRALGMKVIAFETKPNQAFVAEHEIELTSLEELLERSDFVSLHCPLIEATKNLINRESLAKMKPGSIFINTARGGMVDEAALYEALKSGHLRAAGLDVYRQEPPTTDNPLLSLPNVVLSPHIAGCDELSMAAMGVEAAQCIADLYAGRWPTGAVINDELREGWSWRGGSE